MRVVDVGATDVHAGLVRMARVSIRRSHEPADRKRLELVRLAEAIDLTFESTT